MHRQFRRLFNPVRRLGQTQKEPLLDRSPMIQRNEMERGENAAYWDTVRRRRPSNPEKDLMLAVLEDALLNYQSNLGSGGQSFYEDRVWFFGLDNNRLFSFESVCLVLGLNPQRIRKRLLDWESEASTRADSHKYACGFYFIAGGRTLTANEDSNDVSIVDLESGTATNVRVGNSRTPEDRGSEGRRPVPIFESPRDD